MAIEMQLLIKQQKMCELYAFFCNIEFQDIKYDYLFCNLSCLLAFPMLEKKEENEEFLKKNLIGKLKISLVFDCS